MSQLIFCRASCLISVIHKKCQVTFEIMFTTKPIIAVTKRNEKIACTRVARRILVEVTVTSDV